MIKQVHNLLTVHDNLWTLKLDNFSELKNVIGDNRRLLLPTAQRHYRALRTRKNARHFELWRFSVLN